jgi:ABC-type Fe3+-hydroxamate transport system substrate-binding protein
MKLSYIIIFLTAFGCTSLHKTTTENKTTEEKKTETVTATTRTITETFNQPVTVKADTLMSVETLSELEKDGGYVAEDDKEKVKINYNKKEGKFTIEAIKKPEVVQMPGNRQIIESEHSNVKEDDKVKKDDKVTVKERQGLVIPFNPNWLWALFIPAGLIWFFVWMRKKDQEKKV